MDNDAFAAFGNNTKNMIEKLTNHPTLKNLLQQFPNDGNDEERNHDTKTIQAALLAAQNSTGKWIKELSSMANAVVGRCARVLATKPEELKLLFEEEAPAYAKESGRYARNLLEFCCFKALTVATQVPEHLRDKDFRRWTFDMMLAWETPAATTEHELLGRFPTCVETDAFVRLAPAVSLSCDLITVHNVFEVLSGSSGSRLPFGTYNRYLIELDKAIKGIKAHNIAGSTAGLGIFRGEESVIEIDGTATTPVLQHVGVAAWPGRLTLSDQALYFEPSGVVSYDAAKKFDLSADLGHSIKPDMTGPWGARIFDKAVTYKSNAIQEPILLEFPELTGHMRRDYWLAIIREVIAVHAFIRNYKLEGPGRSQALAKVVLGVARIKAVWSLQKALPAKPETLLMFVSADELPRGDLVMKALAATFKAGSSKEGNGVQGESVAGTSGTAEAVAAGDKKKVVSPITSVNGSPTKALANSMGPLVGKEPLMPVGDQFVGEMTALEKAIITSRDNSKQVEKAKATVNEVKVDGIDTNLALTKELCIPLVAFGTWMKKLVCWDEPAKTIIFLSLVIYIIYKDWLGYVIPVMLLTNALAILWLRFQKRWDSEPPGRRNEVAVIAPPNKNAVEQLMGLQQALAQVESVLQRMNIAMLKARALVVSEEPQASDELVAAHVAVAIMLAILPARLVVLMMILDCFTRQLEIRKEGTRRLIRRIMEWWYRIPVVPVRFIEDKHED